MIWNLLSINGVAPSYNFLDYRIMIVSFIVSLYRAFVYRPSISVILWLYCGFRIFVLYASWKLIVSLNACFCIAQHLFFFSATRCSLDYCIAQRSPYSNTRIAQRYSTRSNAINLKLVKYCLLVSCLIMDRMYCLLLCVLYYTTLVFLLLAMHLPTTCSFAYRYGTLWYISHRLYRTAVVCVTRKVSYCIAGGTSTWSFWVCARCFPVWFVPPDQKLSLGQKSNRFWGMCRCVAWSWSITKGVSIICVQYVDQSGVFCH